VKKLHKFILRSFIGPLFLTFFIVMFLLLMQFLWKYIDDLVGKGLDFIVISKLMVYTSASLVPMALPLAILLASIMTFGNLGENYELTALKAAGISLQRIMMPLVIFIIFVSVAAFFFSNNIMPVSNLKMRSLLYDVQQQRPELQIKAGAFYNGIEGYSIKIGQKDPKTNLLKNIKIYDHTANEGNVSVTVADSGYMRMTGDEQYLMVSLYNGATYVELKPDKSNRGRKKTYPERRDKFEKEIIFLELTGFGLKRTDESLFKSHYAMMNLDQLQHANDSLKGELKNTRKNFRNMLTKSSYFKRERNYTGRMERFRRDTALTPVIVTLNYDSLYNNFTITQKQRAVSQALSFARSAKSYIGSEETTVENKIKRLRRYQIEWHRKFTLSFACFIFFFIGAPLGAIIRRGGLGMPVVVSVLFFVLYYVISLSGEKFVREDIWNAPEGMWLSSFILLPLGIFLTYKATTDSTIMNIDTYLSFFKKIRMFMLKLFPFLKVKNER